MHPFLASKFKADWASALQDQRRVLRRINRQQDNLAEGIKPVRCEAMPDDAVIVDSPTSVTHNHPPASLWPWVVLAVALLAAAIVGAPWLVSGRPVASPVVPSNPVQPAPPAPSKGSDYLEFYRP